MVRKYTTKSGEKMTNLSDKEKALIILEKAKVNFEECSKRMRNLESAFRECESALEYTNTQLKRVLNEEENCGNIHKGCEYYNAEKDYCSNYMMGCFTGLAFEVSRHKTCIDDIIGGNE